MLATAEDARRHMRANQLLLKRLNKGKQATDDPFFQHDDDPMHGDKSQSNNRKNKSKIIQFIEISIIVYEHRRKINYVL